MIRGPDPYVQTAIYMVTAALAILYDPDSLARKIGGGILTPATLATPRLFQNSYGSAMKAMELLESALSAPKAKL